jgi:hypothetical protein
VLALASPNFLGNGLLVTLAHVRQQELYPPVEAVLPRPSSLSSYTVACPEDSPKDFTKDISQDSPEVSPEGNSNDNRACHIHRFEARPQTRSGCG